MIIFICFAPDIKLCKVMAVIVGRYGPSNKILNQNRPSGDRKHVM